MQLITCICIIDTNTTWENMLGRNKVDICGPAEIRWKEQGHFTTTDNKSPPEYTILCPYHSILRWQGRPQAGARGCTCTPLDFAFQFFLQNYIHAQSLTQRLTLQVSVSSTERNTRARIEVPQADTRHICPTTLD